MRSLFIYATFTSAISRGVLVPFPCTFDKKMLIFGYISLVSLCLFSMIRRRKGNPPIPYHYAIYYYITRNDAQRLREGCIHTHWIHCALFRVMHIIFHRNSSENLILCNCRVKEWESRGTTFPSYRGAANGRISSLLTRS